MPFQFDNTIIEDTQIKVVGVGGGGGNAVNRMVRADIQGVEFVSMNTDQQALRHSEATVKIALGEKLTRGQGAGGNPERGQRAAEETREEIAASLKGTDMVFITAGMGGGTGTGAAPIVAEVARDLNILTVGIVTKPFAFEGRKRMEQAEAGITALREHVDSLVVIPNEKLRYVSEEKITLANAFQISDDVLRQGVQSISELIKVNGFINLDFADVTSVMKDAGYAHMGIGYAEGENKAELAAQAAIASPLLETSIDGAMGVIVNITAPSDVDLEEVDKASSLVTRSAHPDAEVFWGVAFDDDLQDAIRVTVIATGFSGKPSESAAAKEEEEIGIPSFFGGASSMTSTATKEEDDTNYDEIISIFGRKK